MVGFKIVFIGLMLLLTGPIGTHAIAKAAFQKENFANQTDCENFDRKTPPKGNAQEKEEK